MNKILAGIISILTLAIIASPAMATSWTINTGTGDLSDSFTGSMASGTMQYGVDNTGTDQWYGHEIAKISQKAVWTGKGHVMGMTQYKCPKIAGDAKYGKAQIMNMVDTNKNGAGTFNVNIKSNWKEANNGGGSYPQGNFDWASYGTHLEGSGKYQLVSAIYETTKTNANNHFGYYMTGKGSGKIRYGASSFSSGPNWGDKRGSVSLNRWEYNGAEATGSGTFIEDLGGDNYLQNYKYTLPGGGKVLSTVTFNNGMSSTPIWMSGK
ncbi:MAG: hypothetical protein J7K87_02970 [Candidatus Aenigmarchaeota archaeon]|nr:hypothetical protein [Candidatus Aenigmarchaeota archaeon]